MLYLRSAGYGYGGSPRELGSALERRVENCQSGTASCPGPTFAQQSRTLLRPQIDRWHLITENSLSAKGLLLGREPSDDITRRIVTPIALHDVDQGDDAEKLQRAGHMHAYAS